MARKSAENHKIRAIHLHGGLNGVLVEFLQEAINTSLAPTSSARRVPIPDPNPKYFSIPDPYPICFQNHRVFWVSGIPKK